MKSLISLWNVLAVEMASRCGTSTTLDMKYVQRRTENEGVSFLTITLPSFGKDFTSCLNQGLVSDASFSAFRGDRGCLPSFLRGFTQAVFDSDAGVLLDNPSIESIFAVRQLTLLFSKMLSPCTPERERKAFDEYVECDKEVEASDLSLPDSVYSEFCRLGHVLFSSLFSDVENTLYNEGLKGRHGPGSTADALSSNGKYQSTVWTDRLEKMFPVGEHLFANVGYFNHHYDQVVFLEPGAEIPAKVISVPKTHKTPRIIAMEPSYNQFVQQGLLEMFVDGVQGSFLDSLIGWSDQTPNQRLAGQGSKDLDLASLDLSEASDRVSLKLVTGLMGRHAFLRDCVMACRSEFASVPGNGVIPLSKFASMGSALCFPFEAMVFLTIIFYAIQQEQGHRFVNKREFLPYVDRVRVYGDDIIVPTDYVHTVVDCLELFGAKVNPHKSFWIGRFRESCGKDFYDGQDITIVKVRRDFPSRWQQAQEMVSLIETRNQFYLAGCWSVARWLDEKIEGLTPYYPIVEPSSPCYGRYSFLPYQGERECEHLHRPLVKGLVDVSKSPKDHLDDHGALLKFFLKRGSSPRFDERHLERAGRPRVVRIKPRWTPPY